VIEGGVESLPELVEGSLLSPSINMGASVAHQTDTRAFPAPVSETEDAMVAHL